MSKKKIFILSIAITVVAFELFLREYYGFCDSVLMRADKNFEYIAQPSQKRFRFRKHINYNDLSMRSPSLVEDSKYILGFGDSVLNGGVRTDQDSLATTKLSEKLSTLWGINVQFLNISAGSWGPDNCFAYLSKYGNFYAQKIYLVVSSHDAFDNMDFEPIVGLNPSFPDKQYKVAIVELFDRYLLPRLGMDRNQSAELGISKKNETTSINEGFNSFLNYSKKNKIPLTIYLHADLTEVGNNNYNVEGQQIIAWANENGVLLIKDLEKGLNKTHFRDGIHLNDRGQDFLADLIYEYESFP